MKDHWSHRSLGSTEQDTDANQGDGVEGRGRNRAEKCPTNAWMAEKSADSRQGGGDSIASAICTLIQSISWLPGFWESLLWGSGLSTTGMEFTHTRQLLNCFQFSTIKYNLSPFLFAYKFTNRSKSSNCFFFKNISTDHTRANHLGAGFYINYFSHC